MHAFSFLEKFNTFVLVKRSYPKIMEGFYWWLQLRYRWKKSSYCSKLKLLFNLTSRQFDAFLFCRRAHYVLQYLFCRLLFGATPSHVNQSRCLSYVALKSIFCNCVFYRFRTYGRARSEKLYFEWLQCNSFFTSKISFFFSPGHLHLSLELGSLYKAVYETWYFAFFMCAVSPKKAK